MGNYIPVKSSKPRSITDMLIEAEEDHFLDCPNADFLIRTAALFLDLILLTLAISGVQKLSAASEDYFTLTLIPMVFKANSEYYVKIAHILFLYGKYVVFFMGLYLYLIWSVFRFGGTPAKLLLGLRVLSIHTGKKLRISNVLLREILLKTIMIVSVVGLIGFVLPLIRDDRRALHDLLSFSVIKRIHGGP